MKFSKSYFSSHNLSFFLILFLFFPYFTAIIFNGMYTALVSRSFDVEMILPAAVAMQTEKGYELETLKAQAIIARSNFYRKTEEENGIIQWLYQLRSEVWETGSWKKICDPEYEKAVTDTEGKVLIYDNTSDDILEDGKGENNDADKSSDTKTLEKETENKGQQEEKSIWKQIPYHKMSAGKTRDGKEVFHDKDYSYLQSVESSQDKESEEYLTGIYINKNYLPEKLIIRQRDSAGYVTEVLADGNIVEGEAFRKGLGLVSANFTVQRIGDEVRFLCKGKGHGLGLSQYGGNEMAKDGKTYEEILKAYFPGMQIADVEEVQEILEEQRKISVK